MDLFDVLKACVRRFWVFIPLLLIAAWYASSVYTAVKPVYFGNAVIGLAGASTTNEIEGGQTRRNGLLDVGGAPLIANMTALGLQEPGVVGRVVAQGGSANYSATLFSPAGANQPLPLIKLEVTNPDPTLTTRTLELVIGQATETLRGLQQQAQVPEERMVMPIVVSPPSKPVAGMPTRTRSTVAILAAGIGIAVLVTVLVDVAIVQATARRRRSSKKPSSPTATAAPPPDLDSDSRSAGQVKPAHAAEDALKHR